MAILRSDELRELDAPTMAGRLRELREELYSELGIVAAGGRPKNPGRIRELRRTVARILTIARQRGIDIEEVASTLLPPPQKKEAKEESRAEREGKPEEKKTARVKQKPKGAKEEKPKKLRSSREKKEKKR
ncbi:MAG: 50S ribosomal protein L29 [Candidatus Micrarchaeia archaeon]